MEPIHWDWVLTYETDNKKYSYMVCTFGQMTIEEAIKEAYHSINDPSAVILSAVRTEKRANRAK